MIAGQHTFGAAFPLKTEGVNHGFNIFKKHLLA
jgi:hypothetical protein